MDMFEDNLISDVTKNVKTITQVVEELGPYLTDTDESKRAEGVHILVRALLVIPANSLNREELFFISTFFCDRLKDHFYVLPSTLKGLACVTGMANFPEELVPDLLVALTQNITCQALQQTVRLSYYTILNNLMCNNLDELKKITSEFVFAVISAVDSESDPRNLMFVYGMMPFFLSNFELKHLAEDTFAVLECYFPIDFNPRDISAVTRQELCDGLEKCFLATDQLSEFCCSMVYEKLGSSLPVSIMDSIKLLTKGCKVWTVESLFKYYERFWGLLRTIVLSNNDPKLLEAANDCVSALISRFCESPVGREEINAVKSVLDDVTSNTHSFLADPSLNLFAPSVKLLGTVANASFISCKHVVEMAVPQFMILIKERKMEDVVFAALNPILKASVKFNLWENDPVDLECLNELPAFLVGILKFTSCQNGALQCLADLVPVLTSETRVNLYKALLDMVSLFPNSAAMPNCETFIKTIGSIYPEEVKEQFLEQIIISPEETIRQPIILECKLKAISACIAVPSLASFAIDLLFSNVEALTDLSSFALKSLRVVCENLTESEFKDNFKVFQSLARKSLNFFFKESRNGFFKDKERTTDLSHVIERIIRLMPSSDQKAFVEECLPPFNLVGDGLSMIGHMIVLEGVLSSLHQDVNAFKQPEVCSKILSFGLSQKTPEDRLPAFRLLALLINKNRNEEEVSTILSIIMTEVDAQISCKGLPSIELLVWITKGLVLCGSPHYPKWMDKLTDCLSCEGMQLDAANGFKLLLFDCEQYLISEKYCLVKILHKQRVFGQVDKLIHLSNEAWGVSKSAIFMSIAYILQAAPKELVLNRIKELIQVIVRCLDEDDENVVVAIYEVLHGLLENEVPELEEYIDTFVPKFLQHSQASSMKIRVLALRCLFYMGKYEEVRLLPYREEVIRKLQPILDDRKRLVRREAVRARTRWYLITGLP